MDNPEALVVNAFTFDDGLKQARIYTLPTIRDLSDKLIEITIFRWYTKEDAGRTKGSVIDSQPSIRCWHAVDVGNVGPMPIVQASCHCCCLTSMSLLMSRRSVVSRTVKLARAEKRESSLRLCHEGRLPFNEIQRIIAQISSIHIYVHVLSTQ